MSPRQGSCFEEPVFWPIRRVACSGVVDGPRLPAAPSELARTVGGIGPCDDPPRRDCLCRGQGPLSRALRRGSGCREPFKTGCVGPNRIGLSEPIRQVGLPMPVRRHRRGAENPRPGIHGYPSGRRFPAGPRPKDVAQRPKKTEGLKGREFLSTLFTSRYSSFWPQSKRCSLM